MALFFTFLFPYQYRIIEAKWIDSTQQVFKAVIKMTGIDEKGLVSDITKLMVTAVKFFLGNDEDEEEEDSDDDDIPDLKDVKMANKFNKKTRKRQRFLENVKKS